MAAAAVSDAPRVAAAAGVDGVRTLHVAACEDGVWRVTDVVGHQLHVERVGTEACAGVDAHRAAIAGPAHLAWAMLNAAARRGRRSGAVRLFAGANVLTVAMRQRVEAWL